MYNFLWTVEHNSRAGHNYDKLFTALSSQSGLYSLLFLQTRNWMILTTAGDMLRAMEC